MPDLCPVCKTELKKAPIDEFDRDVTAFSCYKCGNFALPLELIEDIPDILQRNKNADVKISHALRTMQRINKNVELSTSTIDAILEKPLPRPKEQADLLIRWLAEHTANPGDQVSLSPIEHHLSIIGTKTEEGIVLVLSYLIEKVGLVKGTLTETSAGYIGFDELALTFEGWNYYEKLLKGSVTYRKAFMAMKFGDADLNDVIENVFKPSAKMAGFDLFKPEQAGDLLKATIRATLPQLAELED